MIMQVRYAGIMIPIIIIVILLQGGWMLFLAPSEIHFSFFK